MGLISFYEPSAMYTYGTGASGYYASPSTGSMNVNGENTNERITFTCALNYDIIIANIAPVLGTALIVTGFLMWRRRRADNSTNTISAP
jgi:hypothetical protein